MKKKNHPMIFVFKFLKYIYIYGDRVSLHNDSNLKSGGE